MLKLEDIKIGDTLVSEVGTERVVIGFKAKGNVVTEHFTFDAIRDWNQEAIKNWTIKKTPKKLGRLYVHKSTKSAVVFSEQPSDNYMPVAIDEEGNVYAV